MATPDKDSASAKQNQLLECPVCFNSMVELKPRALSCLHTFCEECLQQWSAGGAKICCPTCRKNTQLPAGGVEALPVNFYISQLADNTPSDGFCQICSEGGASPEVATGACSVCQCQLCDTCIARHLSLPAYADHAITALDNYNEENGITCQKHEAKVTIYCKACKEYVCYKCGLDQKHQDHADALVDAKKAIEVEAEALGRQVATMAATLETEVKMSSAELDRCKGVVEQITKEGGARKAMVDKDVEKLITRLRISHTESVSRYIDTLSDIRSEMLQNEGLYETKILEAKRLEDIFDLKKKLENLKERFETSARDRTPSLQFVASASAVEVGSLQQGPRPKRPAPPPPPANRASNVKDQVTNTNSSVSAPPYPVVPLREPQPPALENTIAIPPPPEQGCNSIAIPRPQPGHRLPMLPPQLPPTASEDVIPLLPPPPYQPTGTIEPLAPPVPPRTGEVPVGKPQLYPPLPTLLHGAAQSNRN